MKILFHSIYAPHGNDGVSTSTRQLVHCLQNRGHHVTVYMTDWGWSESEMKYHGEANLRIFKAVLRNNFDLSIPWVRHFMATYRQYDVLHFNSIYSFFTVIGSCLAYRAGKPHVIAPRGNVIPPIGRRSTEFKSQKKKMFWFRLVARKALCRADKIVCNSHLEADSIRRHTHSTNLTWIPNGIDVSKYEYNGDGQIIKKSLGLSADRPLFLYLGRLSTEKAIPFLLDVWESVNSKLPDAILVLAGSGDLSFINRIKQLRAKLANPKSVLMPGNVTGELKNALLHNSLCLLLPSYSESFGNVVLESLACGTPVLTSIGTPWSVLEEKHFGRWLPWENPSWVDAILAVAKDKIFQGSKFRESTRKWVSDNYQWGSVADEYIKVYEDLIMHRSMSPLKR